MILMKTVIIHDSSAIFIHCKTIQKPGLESNIDLCDFWSPLKPDSISVALVWSVEGSIAFQLSNVMSVLFLKSPESQSRITL